MEVDFFYRYTKPKGQLPDYNDPIVLNAEKKSIEDLCLKIHKSLQKDFKWYDYFNFSLKNLTENIFTLFYKKVLFDCFKCAGLGIICKT